MISDEAVVEEEETTPTPQPEVEQPVPGGDLAFERFTVESNGYGPAFADLIDINDDGKLDIVVAQFGQVTGFSLPNGRVTVYLQGNSRTDWTPWEVVSESEGLIWPNDVTAEDIDGDGDLDLWVPAGFLVCGAVPLTSPCGALAWFEQNGNEWIRHDIIPNGDALFYHKALTTDLDGDGINDVITVGEEKTAGFAPSERAEVRWYKGTSSGDRFEKTPRIIGEGLGSLPELYDVMGTGYGYCLCRVLCSTWGVLHLDGASQCAECKQSKRNVGASYHRRELGAFDSAANGRGLLWRRRGDCCRNEPHQSQCEPG